MLWGAHASTIHAEGAESKGVPDWWRLWAWLPKAENLSRRSLEMVAAQHVWGVVP